MSNGQKVASVRYPLEKNRNKLSEKINFYHNDVLGSVTAITDEAGKVVEASIYGPFGETEFSYKATLHKVIPEKRAELLVDPFLYSSDNRYTYTGQEQDEFGGLIYYNARWYDAEVGRFISEDPAAANPNDPLTINRYIYCRNNPLIYTDPTGEIFGIDDFVIILICAVVGAVGNFLDAQNNPKNEWHNGNHNDAFWHGFWQGARVGSLIVSIGHVIESFGDVTKVADGQDIMKNNEALRQKGVGLDSVNFDTNGILPSDYMSRYDFVNPTAGGQVTSFFGNRYHPIDEVWKFHKGIDIADNGYAYAAGNGTVSGFGFDTGYGNYIVVDHGGGISTLYAHGANDPILIYPGQTVYKEQALFTIGETGLATGVHLHFEVRYKGVPIDPSKVPGINY
jgi:RHS repeat-associated protein